MYNNDDLKIMLIIPGILFSVVLGARFAWAAIVFDDWRCALSECRIIKDQPHLTPHHDTPR